MNLVELQRRLLGAARRQAPSDAVPLGFERRVMACLRAMRPEDGWILWGRALWQAAAAALAVSVVLSTWLLLPGQRQGDSGNLSGVYDSTIYAAAEQLSDSW